MKLTCGDVSWVLTWVPTLSLEPGGWGACEMMIRSKRNVVMGSMSNIYVAAALGDTMGRGAGECQGRGE